MKNNLLIGIFFIFLAVLATFPLVLNFSGQLFGVPKDCLPTVWHFWWLDYASNHNLPALVVSIIAAPFGADFRGFPYYPVWNFVNLNLTRLMGPVGAYNIEILLGSESINNV